MKNLNSIHSKFWGGIHTIAWLSRRSSTKQISFVELSLHAVQIITIFMAIGSPHGAKSSALWLLWIKSSMYLSIDQDTPPRHAGILTMQRDTPLERKPEWEDDEYTHILAIKPRDVMWTRCIRDGFHTDKHYHLFRVLFWGHKQSILANSRPTFLRRTFFNFIDDYTDTDTYITQ